MAAVTARRVRAGPRVFTGERSFWGKHRLVPLEHGLMHYK